MRWEGLEKDNKLNGIAPKSQTCHVLYPFHTRDAISASVQMKIKTASLALGAWLLDGSFGRDNHGHLKPCATIIPMGFPMRQPLGEERGVKTEHGRKEERKGRPIMEEDIECNE
ncbi:hypothetical protein HPP92_023319 [Vanilla planifolia]|uniref:Uncharacterized protein n=1 Tax=Vanilla planifolia TaxID=51239 RepID=A0A835PTR5_VANPL|nr:hypothetical protein HPP92_023319 [Vanilla planifolia]